METFFVVYHRSRSLPLVHVDLYRGFARKRVECVDDGDCKFDDGDCNSWFNGKFSSLNDIRYNNWTLLVYKKIYLSAKLVYTLSRKSDLFVGGIVDSYDRGLER